MARADADILPIPHELPPTLCHIFSFRFKDATFPWEPLPAVVRNAHCNPRQLFVWRYMGHGWLEIWRRLESPIDSCTYKTFGIYMRDRIREWERRNCIIDWMPTSRAEVKDIVRCAGDKYTETQLFFGVNGDIDLENMTYAPALDKGRGPFLDPLPVRPVYALACEFQPQDVPDWYREIHPDLITFEDWLQRNPSVYEEFFPISFIRWGSEMESKRKSPVRKR